MRAQGCVTQGLVCLALLGAAGTLFCFPGGTPKLGLLIDDVRLE